MAAPGQPSGILIFLFSSFLQLSCYAFRCPSPCLKFIYCTVGACASACVTCNWPAGLLPTKKILGCPQPQIGSGRGPVTIQAPI